MSKVDDLIYRYSMLTETERRQFDRKYPQFRAVHRQFGGVFERLKTERPRRPAPPAESQK